MKHDDDPFTMENLRLPPEQARTGTVTPRKISKRREQFVMVPWTWVEALSGASGHTWHLAIHVLHLRWEKKGAPIKLANGMLGIDHISRWSKYRALVDLERRGLLTVERQPRKSPTIRLKI
jgi:hypothetical protein